MNRGEAPRGGRSPSGRPIIWHGLPLAAPVLGLLLLWAPWPFGSVTPWAETILTAGILAAFLLALASRRVGAAFRPVATPALALVALALLGLAQSLPWPAAVAEAVSPAHARLGREAAVALEPSGLAPAPTSVPLSLAPAESRRSALTFAVLAAALAAAAAAGRHRGGRRLLGVALLAATLGQVLYGVPRWLAHTETLWGAPVYFAGRLRGTFVNPNHFALYLEIALAAAFAWGWWAWSRAARFGIPPERRVILAGSPALVWLTLFLALAFTGSRAGLVAGVLGTVAQGALVAFRHGLRRQGVRWALSGALVAAAGLAVVAWAGYEKGLARLAATSPYELAWGDRTQVCIHTLELWRSFPGLGTGLGTFLDAFPLVQPASVDDLWRHAHNDPLELLAVTGVTGALLAAVGLFALVRRLLRVLRSGQRREDRAAALAALGALTALGLHGLADFGITMPANALTLAVLVGAAAAAPVEAPAGPAAAEPPGPSPVPARRVRRRRPGRARAGEGREGEPPRR